MADAHVLVVDDEPEIQELVRYNLAKAGYQVSCAGSGEEALSAIQDQPPALVVLDVLLPGLDALDVCKTLKQSMQTLAIPIVMLTARKRGIRHCDGARTRGG